MPKLLSVGEFCRRYATDVPVAVLTSGFCRGWFNLDACPLIGGRRLIPEEQVFPIRAELRRRGYRAEEAKTAAATA